MKVTKSPSRTRFVLRPYRRITTCYVIHYMSGSVIGKGVAKNLSCGGLRVLGDHSLRAGTEVTVRLSIGEMDPPLEIARASVAWNDQHEFGLRIEHMTPHTAHRLAALITADIGIRPSKGR